MHLSRLCLFFFVGLCALNVRAAQVGLLGDPEAKAFAPRLEALAPSDIQTIIGVDAVKKAQPAIALVIIDAAFGPNPSHDIAFSYVARAKPKKFAIVLSEVKKLHDPEIIELIIGEIESKLRAAGLSPDHTLIFLDSQSVRTPPQLKVQKGLNALHAFLKS